MVDSRRRANERLLRAEDARQLLAYDPDTGCLTWRVQRGPKCPAGKTAGSLTREGQLRVSIRTRSYLAERLAWLLTHGRWPRGEVRHTNAVRSDNRLVNLFETECS